MSLPYSDPYEKAALALMLQHPDTSGAVARATLTGEHFHNPAHKALFDAIHNEWDQGEVAVMDRAMKNNAFAKQGQELFTELTEKKVKKEKLDDVVSKLGHYRFCRKVAEMGPELMQASSSGSFEDARSLLSSLNEGLIHAESGGSRMSSVKECLQDTMSEIIDMQQGVNTITRPVGLPILDRETGGLIDTFIMIAGPTSSGKSAMAMQFLLENSLTHKRPGLIFSYEMPKSHVTRRLISLRSGVGMSKLFGIGGVNGETPKFTKPELEKIRRAIGELKEAPIFIEDDPTMCAEDVWGRSVELKSRLGDMGCICVDYIQIMPGSRMEEKNPNRERSISHIGIKLKHLSQYLNCCVLGLSQLGPDFGPRESKALEQHAGNLYKIHRGEIVDNYKRTEIPADEEHLYIWKNRTGRRFIRIPIHFDGERQKFTER